MNTVMVSPEEMNRRIARFKNLKPQGALHVDTGIPREAYEMMTAKTLYLLMAPQSQGGPMAQCPAIVGQNGLSVIIARCPPGDKPALHTHFKTHETFLCLQGRFRIRWGDDGEFDTVIEQFDTIAVPPGVCRDFRNIGDTEALLLVLITGSGDDDFNDIAVAPGESRLMLEKFGIDVVNRFRKLGTNFIGIPT
jgi:uncharacterized RmlC-like cupin family protein